MTKTMKVKRFVEWVKKKAAKVLSLSVSYCGETVAWLPSCGVIVFDRRVQVGELYPDGTLEEALNRIEGGTAHVVFSDIGEVKLRLRP
jgi:hypothetical protein